MAAAMLDRMVRPASGVSIAALAAAAIAGVPGVAGVAAAAGAGGGNANAGSVKCDLCDGYYAHPVTYHMRWAHPGCHQNSDSQGYNSRGEHCLGWAGKCGDGGMGSSTWYLLCGLCRDKYMQEKEVKLSKRDKKASKMQAAAQSGAPGIAAPVAGSIGGGGASSPATVGTIADMLQPQLQQHPQALKSNALFLLELASSGATALRNHGSVTASAVSSRPLSSSGTSGSWLPRVSEDSAVPGVASLSEAESASARAAECVSTGNADDQEHILPFASVPCRYLAQCGVTSLDNAFADDLYPEDRLLWSRGNKASGVIPAADAESHTAYHNRVARFSSDNGVRVTPSAVSTARGSVSATSWDQRTHDRSSNNEPCSDPGTFSDSVSGTVKPNLVQRSLSDIGGIGGDDAPPVGTSFLFAGRRSDRQRKASGSGGTDGGLSLLTSPSPSMCSLIDLARSEPGNVVAAIAQRPALVFVMAQHDLGSLRSAMYHIACLAACRIHALQAFEWILRNASSAGSIHDVLWHFVSCLTVPVVKSMPGSNAAKDAASKKASAAGSNAAAAVPPSTSIPMVDRDELDGVCDHPLADVQLAGPAVLQPLQAALHSLLRIVADVMMYLPAGGPAQQMAVRCFCLRFQPNDHQFLHSSHVFNNISQILSKSDDEAVEEDVAGTPCPATGSACSSAGAVLRQLEHSYVTGLRDITHLASVTVSSRPGMLASLRDGSTETFWESGDEDKNRTKEIVVQVPAGCVANALYVFIDNGRDVQNKVSAASLLNGRTSETLSVAWQREVDGNHCGWIGGDVPNSCGTAAVTAAGMPAVPDAGGQLLLKVELKGSSNSLRVRQLKLLGFTNADGPMPQQPAAASTATTGSSAPDVAVVGARLLATSVAAQQKNCEAETLRVFRWLTSLVFGRLTGSGSAAADSGTGGSVLSDDGPLLAPADKESDLKEHMVGILFSRNRLSHLQRLVCMHIVDGIRKETVRIYDDWITRCCSVQPSAAAEASAVPPAAVPVVAVGGSSSRVAREPRASAAGNQSKQPIDSYCFELLSMLLALSGSRMGRAHLAEQLNLLSDLLQLLHAGTPRVCRQVLLLLRRILPDVNPSAFARVVGASALPSRQLINAFSQYGGAAASADVAAAAASAGSATRTYGNSNGSDAGASNTTTTSASVSASSEVFGALDVLLSCISKALTVQLKRKGVKSAQSVTQANCLKPAAVSDSVHSRMRGCSTASGGPCWWMRGTMPEQTASGVALLLSDMSAGRLSDQWAAVTKAAVGEAILRLTRLRRDGSTVEDHKGEGSSSSRNSGGSFSDAAGERLLAQPALWLALAALCVVNPEHANVLSSASSMSLAAAQQPAPCSQPPGASGDGVNDSSSGQQQQRLCTNHDDGSTAAMLWCAECKSSLCADCDRFLHLSKAKRLHRRQIFREEEESIKIDLHEGCGRAKVFWLIAFADSRTLKAIVELRASHLDDVEATLVAAAAARTPSAAVAGVAGVCRFCGSPAAPLSVDGPPVCEEAACQEHGKRACLKILPCGHGCCGVRNEERCLPCLHGCEGEAAGRASGLRQDADDMCVICFSDALTAAPIIQLQCGHLYHLHCCEKLLQKRWKGPRISFSFCKCCICKAEIDHPALADLLRPIRALQDDVKRKALMRLEYDGLSTHAKVTTPGGAFYGEPLALALDRYSYYVCFKCGKAYYGGQARCQQNVAGDEYDPSELVCGGCSDVARAQMCPKHGTDYLEYKCRYCCSVAVFFCFGTTHFCNLCHDDFQRITSMPKNELPRCPAGPRAVQLEADECPLHVAHPPTGEEYALGCGVCRHVHTF